MSRYRASPDTGLRRSNCQCCSVAGHIIHVTGPDHRRRRKIDTEGIPCASPFGRGACPIRGPLLRLFTAVTDFRWLFSCYGLVECVLVGAMLLREIKSSGGITVDGGEIFYRWNGL